MSNIDPGDIDFLPAKIVADLQAPPPGVIVVWGYLGNAPARGSAAPQAQPPAAADTPTPGATDTYWRLYRTLLFNEYLEFRDADVVFYRKLRENDDWAGTVVWLKEGAPVNYVRSEAMEAQRGFLQGDIAGGGGQPGMQGGGGGSFLCNGAGFVGSFLCGGGGGSFLCGGAGGSFVCGQNAPGSFLCGGGGGSFLCGGAGGSFLCGGAGGSFVYC